MRWCTNIWKVWGMHYAVIWPTKRSFMIISSIWPKIWTLRNLFMESIANGGHRLLDTTVVEVFLIIIFLGSIFIIILVVIIIGWMTFPIRAFPSQIWFKVKSSQVMGAHDYIINDIVYVIIFTFVGDNTALIWAQLWSQLMRLSAQRRRRLDINDANIISRLDSITMS